MGNVENLNHTQRTYIPNNRRNPDDPTPSRALRDIFGSLRHTDSMSIVDESVSPMIGRVAGKIPHVGVVGAGVAGLRCAEVLLQHGAKVTILEGRDRVGGRVRIIPEKN
jgi:NADPH-dependent 2,4-dienoyl-CoA reductase/sulfur reductase-like enzyme